MQNLLKDSTTSSPEKSMKPLPSLGNFPSTSTQIPNFNGFNPFPALTNLQALHQLSTRSPPAPPIAAASSVTQTPYKSPTTTTSGGNNATSIDNSQSGASPLDLSSSSTPPLAKRMKLSPTSSETVTTQQQPQRQQQATSPPNVTTTNNQLTTSSSSTVGFSASSSSSTTSNGSEQASGSAQSARKCQLKIDEINAWNVDEVCCFVEGIAICAEYVKVSPRVSISFFPLKFVALTNLLHVVNSSRPPYAQPVRNSHIFSTLDSAMCCVGDANKFCIDTVAVDVSNSERL